MDMIPEQRDRHSKRNSTACEHCRSARIRCKPSEQPGVCEKCLALKRECISRTKPRPRRWERTWRRGDRPPSPPSPGQISTFSIDYSVPVKPLLDDGFETLREMHEQALDIMFIENDPLDTSQSPSLSVGLPSPSNSSNQSRTNSDIWRQPIFNMASAESLLDTFKSMANYLPFITLPGDSSVSQLAATRPFVLLSVLTVASGSGMVQKHTLYDDEFRKALGLKYVSGGERSLELLQGLLIYCAWYPFHLRPKNGQLVHCLRMAADLIQELHLDEDFLCDPWGHEVTDDEIDGVRAYLAYVYLVSTYIVVWNGERSLATQFPPWAYTAIDVLQRNARCDSDATLVAQARLSLLFFDASDAINGKDLRTVQNSQLLLIGLEHQYQEVLGDLNTHVLGTEALRMQMMFLDIFLDCGSLLAFPVAKPYLSPKIARFPPPLSKICSGIKKMRALLDYVSELQDQSLLSFTISDWTRLIVMLTLAFRLSFPLPACPDLDSAWTRSEIQLDQFLSKVSHGAEDSKASNDIVSAGHVVLGVMKAKYDRRLGLLDGPPSATLPSRMSGCPVMGGSLRSSVEQWDPEAIDLSRLSAHVGEPNSLPLFHDVWTTMTMGWGNVGDMPWSTFEENLWPLDSEQSNMGPS